MCSVDSVLDPDNRLHMTVEEQLKELLEKLDFVTSMRCSGARTRRIRLLRREINKIRYRQGQTPSHSSHNGYLKEEDEEDEEDNDNDAKADNTFSSSDKGEGWKIRDCQCINLEKPFFYFASLLMRSVVNMS